MRKKLIKFTIFVDKMNIKGFLNRFDSYQINGVRYVNQNDVEFFIDQLQSENKKHTSDFASSDKILYNETIDWHDIKPGDVVLEGIRDLEYRVLTDVDGTYWEYLDPNDGYYHSTSPEYCHYLVKGQKSAGRNIIKIEYKNEVK